jgi:hypothetical protein
MYSGLLQCRQYLLMPRFHIGLEMGGRHISEI